VWNLPELLVGTYWNSAELLVSFSFTVSSNIPTAICCLPPSTSPIGSFSIFLEDVGTCRNLQELAGTLPELRIGIYRNLQKLTRS
jgi:hypothetical protein